MERLIPRVPNARYVLVSTSDSTRGHGTHSRPSIWRNHLADFLRFLPPIVTGAASPGGESRDPSRPE
jgi:homoserine O-acetyltransferase